MVHQLIGFSEKPEYSPKPSDQLAIEIDPYQIVLLVKNNQTAEIEAIEMYQFEASQTDWTDVFLKSDNSPDYWEYIMPNRWCFLIWSNPCCCHCPK